MKLSALFVTLVTCTLGLAAPTSSSLDLAGYAKDLPACSLECIAVGAAEYGCDITDIPCQCGKMVPLVKADTPCLVRAGCSLKEITSAAQTIFKMCDAVGIGLDNSNSTTLAGGDAKAAQTTESPQSAASRHLGAGFTVAVSFAIALVLS